MALFELNASPLISDGNLVAYYRLEGNSNDSKGSAHGSDSNVLYNASYGIFGQGAYYNGNTNCYTHLPDSTVPTGANTKSINAWFRTSDATAKIRMIIVGGSAAGGLVEFALALSPDSHLSTNNGSYVNMMHSPKAVNDGGWHMGTLTYDGVVMILYLDGVVVGQKIATLATDTHCSIGSHQDATSITFIGDIDDVSIWSRALTPEEVKILCSPTVNYLKKYRRFSFQ